MAANKYFKQKELIYIQKFEEYIYVMTCLYEAVIPLRPVHLPPSDRSLHRVRVINKLCAAVVVEGDGARQVSDWLHHFQLRVTEADAADLTQASISKQEELVFSHLCNRQQINAS